MTIFSVVLGLYAFLCFCLASWRFSGYLFIKGKDMGLAGLILGFEICSAISTFTYYLRNEQLESFIWSTQCGVEEFTILPPFPY